ncbi:hypothetical protein [Mucilaginibacter sp.]|nr:hypothetical protein [Mucilaginibacter sp.]
MKILKVKGFRFRDALVEFVNSNNIQREDILIITEGMGGPTLYYYD